jgi:putative iron-dependent peroxidase
VDRRAARGLVFVAFGSSLAPLQALLDAMPGSEDGVVDVLFTFTRPLTGSTLWCPPVGDGRVDLHALGIG